MKTRKPISSHAHLDWKPTAAFVAALVSGDRKLLVFVQPNLGEWQVLALETSSKVKSEQEVLDNHGHKVVGGYLSPVDAFGAAESFAVSWAKGHKATSVRACACDEIAPG